MIKFKSYLFAFIGLSLMSAGAIAQVAPPPAGTLIGNTAKATYTDEMGDSREVQSNTVVTRVEQIYALDLQQDNHRIATRGAQVYFQHTVTNLGNGPDTFDLTAVAGGTVELLPIGGASGLTMYVDSNQDGTPDNYDPITSTTQLEAGQSFHFVIVGIVPQTATAGDGGSVVVTATSSDGVATDTNTDTFVVTDGAAINVVKSVDVPNGTPGTGPVTYTLRYTNTGNQPAANFTITDVIPTGMTYVAGSARWSQSGTTELQDNGVGNPTGINYDFDTTTAGAAVFEITTVAAGHSGFVTFQVNVNPGIVPQVINNQAQYTWDGEDPLVPYESNIVPFRVIQVAGVDFDGDDRSGDTAPAGSTVTFRNELTNTGTGIDTFDITLQNDAIAKAFPAGTTFQLYQEDGETPLSDSNNNGIPDTGPLAPGATYMVVMKAILPNNIAAADATGPFVRVKVATSSFDPTVSAEAEDILGSITTAGVDLQAMGPLPEPVSRTGQDVFPEPGEADRVVYDQVNPGSVARIHLIVENTGPRTDTFDLLASMGGSFGVVSDMNPGWSVVFRQGHTPGGSIVSNSGPIPAGGEVLITAEITVPAGTPPTTNNDYPVYFRSKSQVSDAVDHLHAEVVVNTVRGITLQTDNVGQVFPGGSVEYQHILTNVGNVTEGATSGSDIAIGLVDSRAGIGFTSAIYYNVDGSGELQPTDPIITSDAMLADIKAGGLASGESIRLIVKVYAPLGVAEGQTNVTTVTVVTSGDINGLNPPADAVNRDTTSVIDSDLELVKEQAVVPAGSEDNFDISSLTWSRNQLAAEPGQVIVYRVTVTNSGSADATAIVVYDTVPAHTTYHNQGDAAAAVSGDGTEDDVELAGDGRSFKFTIGTLTPQQSAVITFGVKINTRP